MSYYLWHIRFDCHNEICDDFSCSRHRSLHGEQSLHSRRGEKSEHEHQIKRICVFGAIFSQRFKCSA